CQPFSLREIWTDTKIIEAICKAGPQDQDYTSLLDSVKSSASRRLNPNLSSYTVKNNLPFHRHRGGVVGGEAREFFGGYLFIPSTTKEEEKLGVKLGKTTKAEHPQSVSRLQCAKSGNRGVFVTGVEGEYLPI
ncbi:uncharacterized protein VP01_7599g1, partial [Puccinia sorghi]